MKFAVKICGMRSEGRIGRARSNTWKPQNFRSEDDVLENRFSTRSSVSFVYSLASVRTVDEHSEEVLERSLTGRIFTSILVLREI